MSGADLLLPPALRGSLHRWAAPIAVALTVLLAVRAETGGARATVIIYGVCVSAMLAVSATYHARRWFNRPRRVLRRCDHAAIFLAIAGTYTAVIVLALDGATRIVLLVLAWVIAAFGIAIRMVWFDSHHGPHRRGIPRCGVDDPARPPGLCRGAVGRRARPARRGRGPLHRRRVGVRAEVAGPVVPRLRLSRGVPHVRGRRRADTVVRRASRSPGERCCSDSSSGPGSPMVR